MPARPDSRRRLRLVLTLAGALAMAVSHPARSQDLPVAEPGARLRLTIAGGRQQITGAFLARQGDAIDFLWRDAGDRMQNLIPLRDVQRIEMARGKQRPVVRTAAKGAAIGLAVGIASAFMVGRTDCPDVACETRADAMQAYGLGLGAAGLTIGVVRGAIGFDRWVPASITGWRPPGA